MAPGVQGVGIPAHLAHAPHHPPRNPHSIRR
jgi:hypothetical protein